MHKGPVAAVYRTEAESRVAQKGEPLAVLKAKAIKVFHVLHRAKATILVNAERW